MWVAGVQAEPGEKVVALVLDNVARINDPHHWKSHAVTKATRMPPEIHVTRRDKATKLTSEEFSGLPTCLTKKASDSAIEKTPAMIPIATLITRSLEVQKDGSTGRRKSGQPEKFKENRRP
jgi:hypothetical protein